ncbi:MAG: hypothetical protein JRI73_10865 [Deltaproteobacteria bacterium]|nr:hypothetical protein [Deltaproteobacteria bacterium]
MLDDHTINIKLMERPHVVIIGAGASRAATPESEKSSMTIDHSWLNMHPRLTCEALYESTMMLNPIKPTELPNTTVLNELQQWVAEFDTYFPKFKDEGPEWLG